MEESQLEDRKICISIATLKFLDNCDSDAKQRDLDFIIEKSSSSGNFPIDTSTG